VPCCVYFAVGLCCAVLWGVVGFGMRCSGQPCYVSCSNTVLLSSCEDRLTFICFIARFTFTQAVGNTNEAITDPTVQFSNAASNTAEGQDREEGLYMNYIVVRNSVLLLCCFAQYHSVSFSS
jgi:hypothetical protein